MSTGHDPMLNRHKIFPRNLTAFAATKVRGNPANARPESGVDNTHPGLEFDQRNLDKAFFPGLTFEFQFLHGARLAEVHPELFESANDLQQTDVDSNIFLYYLFGAFGAQPHEPRLVELHRTDGSTDGYEVLRTVHDLEPGRVMVVVGTKDPIQLSHLGAKGMEFFTALSDPAKYAGSPPAGPPAANLFRDPDTGKLLAAIFVGNRARYLDDKGVITVNAVPPGELTRSLCAPWQWDFADCGCHYWAANKPDIVFGKDSTEQNLNFQRIRDPKPSGKNPALKPSSKYEDATVYAQWTKQDMTQQHMINDWEKLPFVIAEHESSRAVPGSKDKIQVKWTRAKIV